MSIQVRSSDFVNGGSMPPQSLCPMYKGTDTSPHLEWSAVEGAKSYAIVCIDPDLPKGGQWIHWIVTHIPSTITSLPALKPIKTKYVVLPNNEVMIQGLNTWGTYSFGGPCPSSNLPKVTHHYIFNVYALNSVITDVKDIDKYTIAKGTLVGTFLRP